MRRRQRGEKGRYRHTQERVSERERQGHTHTHENKSKRKKRTGKRNHTHTHTHTHTHKPTRTKGETRTDPNSLATDEEDASLTRLYFFPSAPVEHQKENRAAVFFVAWHLVRWFFLLLLSVGVSPRHKLTRASLTAHSSCLRCCRKKRAMLCHVCAVARSLVRFQHPRDQERFFFLHQKFAIKKKTQTASHTRKKKISISLSHTDVSHIFTFVPLRLLMVCVFCVAAHLTFSFSIPTTFSRRVCSLSFFGCLLLLSLSLHSGLPPIFFFLFPSLFFSLSLFFFCFSLTLFFSSKLTETHTQHRHTHSQG
jgi:hypothetical protein